MSFETGLNLFDLSAKITMDSRGYEKGIADAKNMMKSAAKTIGTYTDKIIDVGETAAKTIGTISTAMATAVGGLIKESVEEFSDYEQLVGGVETLFKESSDLVMTYANGAYKTAGMSANAYMETVTSFSASLLQGLAGDTETAAKYANLAITDMSDNANKMGTDISMIQSAYQGFAKQNYTMLDNLKLGYGGTAAEMARLVMDSGVLGDNVKVTAKNINDVPFDQIIKAIHVIQTNMGIAGTTAAEASSTIQGSFAAAKAAATNFAVGLADDTQNIEILWMNLVESVATAADNLLPRIGITFGRIMDFANERAEVMTTQALDVVISTATGKAPALITTTTGTLKKVLSAVNSKKTELKNAGMELFGELTDAFEETVDAALPLVEEFAPAIAEGFIRYSGTMFETGGKIVMSVVNGFSANSGKISGTLVDVVKSGLTFVDLNAEDLATGALNIGTALVTALGDNLPDFVETGVSIIGKIGKSFTSEDGKNKIKEGVDSLVNGLCDVLDSIDSEDVSGAITTSATIIDTIFDTFFSDKNTERIEDSLSELFTDVLYGVVDSLPTLGALFKKWMGRTAEEGVDLADELVVEFGKMLGVDGIEHQVDRVTFFDKLFGKYPDSVPVSSGSKEYSGVTTKEKDDIDYVDYADETAKRKDNYKHEGVREAEMNKYSVTINVYGVDDPLTLAEQTAIEIERMKERRSAAGG